MSLVDDIHQVFETLKPINDRMCKHALIDHLINMRKKVRTPQTAAAYSSAITKLSWRNPELIDQWGERHSVIVARLRGREE